MRRAALALPSLSAAMLAASAALAQAPPPPDVPIVIDATESAQPIRAPSGDLRVTITQKILPVGGGLPAHKHPFPRIVNVLAGRLRVTNLDTGQMRELAAGDWAVDPVGQWHEAAVLGAEPVRMLTIDQAPPGAALTVPRPLGRECLPNGAAAGSFAMPRTSDATQP